MMITDAIISVLEWFFSDKCHILGFNSYECLYWWLKLSKMVYGLCRTVYFCFKSSFVSITFMSVYCHVASCHIMVYSIWFMFSILLIPSGTFKLTLQFTEDYPNKPPTVRFVSRMFHPNSKSDARTSYFL